MCCWFCRQISTITLRVILLCLTLAFLVLGLIMTVEALYSKSYHQLVTQIVPELSPYLTIIPTASFLLGGFVLVISLIGCCGVTTGLKCKILIYAVFLLISCGFKILLGAWSMIEVRGHEDLHRRDIRDDIAEGLKQAVRDYDKSESVREVIDGLQRTLNCCGAVIGWQDWNESMWFLNRTLPRSCCPIEVLICGEADAYKKGCAMALFDYVWNNVRYIAFFLIAAGLIELIAAVLACCLQNSLIQEHREDRREYDDDTDEEDEDAHEECHFDG